ncbi:zinc transporter, ZIP family [Clostridium collagenovorans DSM 3089]|uniref:Zinc transporter, ZIP family n=1 Tax=Clostridium collagenovorans DSM 3089 TaxID=1121306 RepID=A0A1M5W354_9CLOT|nr:ZIP family metal transporter [Clostridium collagenovorans]SHH81870.1 zinc transporter, ZIP family [Clostridium collagenovorans DSM 3089]
MSNVHNMVMFSLVMSMIGTMIGAFIGVQTGTKTSSKKFLGYVTAIACGIMISISIFELIPEAYKDLGGINTLIFLLFGMGVIYIGNKIAESFNGNKHKRVAFMVGLSLALHNFPEGLVVGLGFASGATLALKMSIIIMLHDIPEGVAVASPLKFSDESNWKIYFYALVTGLPAVLGTLIGLRVGSISPMILAISLALAGGVMMYVSLGQMYFEAKEACGGKYSFLYTLVGIGIGLFMVLAF